ncbi:hypothetical protein CRG98_034267 [Punica granatum]|uniref:Uncharacterized protein n=1 Tax=Punica granatum TaxID=22663 RepID=A0A2I0IMU7_PUNGR|nr:hypothetical protein CRG98_034267 [Punica granatum]
MRKIEAAERRDGAQARNELNQQSVGFPGRGRANLGSIWRCRKREAMQAWLRNGNPPGEDCEGRKR